MYRRLPCIGLSISRQPHVCVHPEIDIEIIIPHRENMEQLLKQLSGGDNRLWNL